MNTKMANGTQMTLEEWMPEIFQKPIAGASGFPVRTSLLPEKELDSTESDHLFSSKLCDCLTKGKRMDLAAQDTFSLRTLKTCLVSTGGAISQKFSLHWMKEGSMRNGRCLTRKTLECRRTGSVCLLSDILEVEVPQKYFLSKEQTERIVFAESGTETDTAGTRKSSIGGGITEALDTAQGGGRGHHTIEVIGKAYDRDNYGDNRNRVLGEGGVLSEPDGNAVQGTLQNRVITVGNTNPSGKGMNGNCYSSDGINPTLTCNKNEGNRVAVPVDCIDSWNRPIEGGVSNIPRRNAYPSKQRPQRPSESSDSGSYP